MTGDSIIRDPDGPGWLVCSSPIAVYTTARLPDVPGIIQTVEERVESERLFAVGFLSYESAPAFDRALAASPAGDFPLAWFALYRDRDVLPRMDLECTRKEYHVGEWQSTIGREEYHRNIDTIRARIREGDTYQVNFTYRLRARFSGDPLSYFRSLVEGQETPYTAFIDAGRYAVCSVSPELFFRLDNTTLVSRPMKGTSRRGFASADDRDRGRALQQSEKDRAENIMIVDMVRNDIGRVAEEGSVHVPHLCALEQYPTVWQLTSTVTGRTSRPVSEIIRALFPAASITGAPKARTMSIIRELESTPRNLYTGSLGWLGPGRRTSFSVAIRTAVIDTERNEAEYGVGGGITWGSTGAEEYDETRTKALVLREQRADFQLLETLLWRPGTGFSFLEEHLERLAGSADYFSFNYSSDDVRRTLLARTATWDPLPQRVRLLVSRHGVVTVETEPLPAPPVNRRPRVRLAQTPVASDNRFLYHKTTFRWMYDQARASSPDCDDVILWNERGELTESTMANLVLECRGRLLTPPVSSGLLPGVYRASLLRDGKAEEQILTQKDLALADRVILVNSVRGSYEVDVTD